MMAIIHHVQGHAYFARDYNYYLFRNFVSPPTCCTRSLKVILDPNSLLAIHRSETLTFSYLAKDRGY